MKIAICGSMQFAKEMLELKSQLEAMGHSIEVPKDVERYATGEKSVETKWEKVEGDLIRGYFEKIKQSDAVLIVNKTKNGIDGYIGGNALLEMGFAHVLGKLIYLMHPIPYMHYMDEIESMKPMILNGDVESIVLNNEQNEGSHVSRLNSHISPYAVPRVGIDILILKDGKVLAGKRKGAHGAGEYSFPGGSLEMMESYADCARRETLEECGVKIKNIRFNFTANSFHFDPRHYICIGLVADWESGEPTVMEPEKCESWDWYDLDQLPSPMFIYCKLAVDAYLTGNKCIDSDGSVL